MNCCTVNSSLKRYQCTRCRNQAKLTFSTILQATKQPLSTYFLVYNLIGQAKTEISSLGLSRHLGVYYYTAWLLERDVLRAMTDREGPTCCGERLRLVNPTSGNELMRMLAVRSSENKIPIIAAISLNRAGHPIHVKITAVTGFSSGAIPDWTKRYLMPGSQVLSDGLACFHAVTTAN